MNETTESNSATNQGREFWRAHVMAAQDFIGTDAEYCKRNGLNDKTFWAHKSKYGFTKPAKGRPKKFVKVETEPVRATPQSRSPDPKWLGEFVAILLAGPR